MVTYRLQVQAEPCVPWVTGKKGGQRFWFQRPAATYPLLRVEPVQHRWEALLAAHQDPTWFSWSTDIFPDAHMAEVVASHSSPGAHGKALPLQLLMWAGACGPTSANESWGSSPAEGLQQGNTNRKKQFFPSLLSILRPVSSHGRTPHAVCSHTCLFLCLHVMSKTAICANCKLWKRKDEKAGWWQHSRKLERPWTLSGRLPALLIRFKATVPLGLSSCEVMTSIFSLSRF